MWQMFHSEERFEDAPEDVSFRRELAGMCGMRHYGGMCGLTSQTPPNACSNYSMYMCPLWAAAQLHHRPSLAPAAPHSGPASQLRPLWQEFQVVQLPEDSPEDAQRREALLLRHLRSHVYTAQQLEITSGWFALIIFINFYLISITWL